MTTQSWAVLLGAYLLGSIPSAFLVARLVAGVDVRWVGDGNMGAKNTFESVGRLPGVVVAFADAAKGAVAVIMARQARVPENVVLWAGAFVVLGHDFSIFMRLRGGQGMAAMVGVFAVFFLREVGLSLLVLALLLALTRNWDLSCSIGFALLPILLGLFGRPVKEVLYPVLMLPTIGLKKLMMVWHARRVVA
jgi:glycerol-3-phosphate acyltransferase PlsY